MNSKFSTIILTAALVAGLSGLAHANDSAISVRQYQALSDESPVWQLHRPVFDKTPSSFHNVHPYGLSVRQYQALSDASPTWQLSSPVFDNTPSSFHRVYPHGLPLSQYQAWSDEMHQWQLPNRSKASALASTDEAAVAKSAANEPFGVRIAELFHVSQTGSAPSTN